MNVYYVCSVLSLCLFPCLPTFLLPTLRCLLNCCLTSTGLFCAFYKHFMYLRSCCFDIIYLMANTINAAFNSLNNDEFF